MLLMAGTQFRVAKLTRGTRLRLQVIDASQDYHRGGFVASLAWQSSPPWPLLPAKGWLIRTIFQELPVLSADKKQASVGVHEDVSQLKANAGCAEQLIRQWLHLPWLVLSQ